MQKRSNAETRYEVACQPTIKDGYVQRIEIWKAVKALGSTNRSELLKKLNELGHRRPNGALVDEAYCRIELTDMTKRGFLNRVSD